METEPLSSTNFFRQTPILSERLLPPPVKKSAKPRTAAPTRSPPQPDSATINTILNHNGSSRRKQSKSRSGCMTCKKKRIKCDETKPTCLRCEKRNVECEGYKPHYKWLSFDDTTKPPPGSGKPQKKQNTAAQADGPTHGYVQRSTQSISSYLEEDLSWSPGLQSVCTYMTGTEYLTPAVEDELISPREQLSPSQFDLLSDLDSSLLDSDVELISALPLSSDQSSGSYDKEFDDESMPDCAAPFTPGTDSPYSRFRASSPVDFQNLINFSQSAQVTPSHDVYLDHSSPEMLLLRFDKETCDILSIKEGLAENPWRTFIKPLVKDSDALYHAILAMAALHGATSQPRLRLVGVTHMTKSISKLSTEMHSMSWNQILASALALCLSEGWDDKISTGMKHLKGARPALRSALARRSRNIKQGQLSRDEAEPLQFLSNTFVYLEAIARLTSSEDHDNIDLDNTVQAVNETIDSRPIDSQIDPLMGCATTLFPLLGKVASLIQRIRRTSSNSLSMIGEANELREQLLHWEPPDMDLLEQSQDAKSNIQHVLLTAGAYHRAILLHLHSAITEISSESSHDQAQKTLGMIARTPLSSRTMIVQIFPLLVGSCEMVNPDDRKWVSERWDAMKKRLTLVSVSSCWKIVKEVWRRRDQWVETGAQQMRPTVGRSMSSGPFVTRAKNRNDSEPNHVAEDVLNSNFQERYYTSLNDFGQTHGRRSTFEVPYSVNAMQDMGRFSRNYPKVSLLNGAPEYTVRGQLHWLSVMSDWNWEVFL